MERAFNFSSLVKLPQYCPHGGKKVPMYGYLLKVGNIMKVRSGKERYAGFELAVRNLQFAKHFGSLRMNFCIFSKNCELLKSDTYEFLELFTELAISEVILSLINIPC